MKDSVGRKGEQYAADYLIQKGYQIQSTNYHSRYGEIDIVALKEPFIVFAEVKVRSNTAYGLPREYVTETKKRRIIQTALQYASAGKRDVQYRFDVIEIVIGKKEPFEVLSLIHIENAFDASGY